MPHTQAHIDIWSVEGRFQQFIYSPKGAIEGLLIDTDGVATQFVCDPHDPLTTERFASLRPGQALVVEGCETEPSHKGEAEHTVYAFERLASIDGTEADVAHEHGRTSGTVVRFNYAKHGAANGVVLDNGDFVHTKPDGFARLALKIGDKVDADGPAQRLVTGGGRVIEAHSVNGKPLGPVHD